MTSDLYRRILPNDPCLHVWLRAIKGPSPPLMKYAHRLRVRLKCGPTMMTFLIAIFTTFVNNEVIKRRAPMPLFAHDYERWTKWNLHAVCPRKGIKRKRTRRILASLQYWGDARINVVVVARINVNAYLNFVTNEEISKQRPQ